MGIQEQDLVKKNAIKYEDSKIPQGRKVICSGN